MRHSRRLACALVLALGTSASAQPPAPQDAQDPPRFQSGVELIQIDVSVLDRNRRPVTGLTAADFTVLENGTPRPVRAFVPIQLPGRSDFEMARPQPEASPPDVATNAAGTEYGRLVIILMDRTIPPGEPTLTAKRVAIAAIDALGPQDLAAVATTGPGIPQSPTADRTRLIAAVNRGDWSTGLSKEQEDVVVIKDDPLSDGRCLCGLCVLEGVTRISDAVQHVPRRRKVLFFIGRSVIFQVGPRAPSADIGCSRRVTDAQRALFDSLARSNLTVHAFDPQGLVNIGAYSRASSPGGIGVNAPAARRQQLLGDTADHLRDQGSIAVLPDRTGGRAVLNTNAPETEVPDILDESSSYYLLAFEPGTPGRDAGRRAIEVKVARRGVTVVAQRQHVLPRGAGDASATVVAAAVRPALDDALAGVLPVAARPLASRAAAFATTGSRAILSVTVDVAAFAAAGRAVPLEVGALALDQQGRQVAFARQTTTVELPSSPSSSDTAVDVMTQLELPPGDYELRVAVSDPAAGAAASVFSQVTVPEFQRAALSLSDVSLEMGRASAREGAPGLARHATTRRTFRPGEEVRAFLQIYQGTDRADAIVPVTVRGQLRDASGRIVRDQSGVLTEAAFPDRRADVALDIERLPPGEYVLSLEASTARQKAARTIAFAVQHVP